MQLLWYTMEYGINVCQKCYHMERFSYQCDMCRNFFSAIYGVCLLRMGATETQITRLALEFLIGITIVAFIILRILAFINQKKNQRPANDQDEKAASLSKMEYIKIYNAQNIVETEQIMEMLKQNGIVAFSQEPGANVAMHVVSGFGIYGVDIFVKKPMMQRRQQSWLRRLGIKRTNKIFDIFTDAC